MALLARSGGIGRERLFGLSALLFVPVLRERFVASALRADPPAVILDLEDSIPMPEKARARAAVQQAAAAFAARGVPVFVRVNRGDLDDLDACGRAMVDGVFLPKVERPSEAEQAADILEKRGGERRLIVATIETASGVVEANAIAGSRAVDALMFGPGDFVADAGFALDGSSLRVPATMVSLAAHARGKPALGLMDGALGVIDDVEALFASAVAARSVGYTGAPVIHPAQIAPVERGFTPGAAEIAAARCVVAAFEASDGGAARIGAELVERPAYLRATAILRASEDAFRRSETRGKAP